MSGPEESRSAAPFSSLQEYVTRLSGTRVIRKVLIANNGIAAVKAIRSIRKWAYETFGNEKTVRSGFLAAVEVFHALASASGLCAPLYRWGVALLGIDP